jgi:hypothetical protein
MMTNYYFWLRVANPSIFATGVFGGPLNCWRVIQLVRVSGPHWIMYHSEVDFRNIISQTFNPSSLDRIWLSLYTYLHRRSELPLPS